ncbi:unnamed protein product [Ilex paraguariensis]|uniref:Disease resistance protein At4g27190-like leucine-rich repeats domain-containing protein n=1 Tax=Ilex paraguariensis TaxID=185542 RepID=A0ABC8SVN1_9AQUA
MEKIWHELLLPTGNFNTLTELSISSCGKLITIFPSSLVQLLQNLVDLSISNCDLLKDLCEGHNATLVTLPRIKNFKLLSLPSLKDIWWSKVCPESLNFRNLTHLTIGGCKCRRYLLSFTPSKLLIQLQYLELVECDMMKEIRNYLSFTSLNCQNSQASTKGIVL